MGIISGLTGKEGENQLEKALAGLPADVLADLPSKRQIIAARIKEELVKLEGLKVNEPWLQRASLANNKQAEQALAMNRAQQKGTRDYVIYLVEKWREAA